jgi:small subunit ribosomal protein S17
MAADEGKNENVEEKNDAPKDEAPAEDAPKDEAPAEDAPKEEAPAEDAPKEEAPAEDAPKEEAPAEGSDAGEAAGDDEELDWKAKARLERSRQPHEAGPQRSTEERVKERSESRKQAGKNRSAYRKKIRGKKAKGGEGTPPAERESVGRKVRQGMVVSSKGDKTITVRIDVARRHPVYEKIVRRSQTLHAHDERNEAGDGDFVQIVETRPISKTKRWRLTEILEKAK